MACFAFPFQKLTVFSLFYVFQLGGHTAWFLWVLGDADLECPGKW